MNAAYTPQGMTRYELRNLQRKAFFGFLLKAQDFLEEPLRHQVSAAF
jgi:hypothetical protein